MRIGFWFDYDQTYTFVALFREIQRRAPAASVSGYVINDRYWRHALDNLPAGSYLVRLYDQVNEGRNYSPTAEELRWFRQFDGDHHLARVAYSDRHLRNYTREQLVGLYVYLIRKFHDYIDVARPDVFVFNCVASHFAHLFYLVLRERKVKVIIPFGLGFDELVYLCDNPYLTSEDIWATHQRYRSGAERPPEEAVRWAEGTIARIRQQQAAYQVGAIMKVESRRFSIPGPAGLARYLCNYVRYYRKDPNLPSVWGRVREVVSLHLNRLKSRRFVTPLERVAGAPFLFYPLHYEPELATLVFSQYDQFSVIDIVARQLPISWVLVVKDHPVMIGQRDYRFYQRVVERYPNVVFVDAGLNAQRLAEQAQAVLTLSGTIALEAMVLGKPVVFTSPIRFGNFGVGTLSQDLINFGSVLKSALQERHDDADLVRMLAAIWRHCDRFEFVEPLGRPSVLSADNIQRMATAIMRKAEQTA